MRLSLLIPLILFVMQGNPPLTAQVNSIRGHEDFFYEHMEALPASLSPEAIATSGFALLDTASQCETRVAAIMMLRQAQAFGAPGLVEIPQGWKDLIDGCDTLSWTWTQIAGHLAFQSEKWLDAIDAYQVAASLANNGDQKILSINGACSATYESGQMTEGDRLLESLIRLPESRKNPYVLHNIAATFIERGFGERGLEIIGSAIEMLSEKEEERYAFHLLGIDASNLMNDCDVGRLHFEAIQRESPQKVANPSGDDLRVIMAHCAMCDEKAIWQLYQRSWQSAVDRIITTGDSAAFADGNVERFLFRPWCPGSMEGQTKLVWDWHQAVARPMRAEFRQFESARSSVPSSSLSNDELMSAVATNEGTTQLPEWTKIVMLVLAGLTSLTTWLWWSNKKQTDSETRRLDDSDHAKFGDMKTAEVARHPDWIQDFGALTDVVKIVDRIEAWHKLNESEKAITLLLLHGATNDEILMHLRISDSYFYNLRSKVRQKLSIPADYEIVEWLRANNRVHDS